MSLSPSCYIITAVSLLISGIKSDSCGKATFKNWLGDKFTVNTKEVCTSSVLGVCLVSKCSATTDIFEAAIDSTNWDWALPRCNDEYLIGHENTDDMECSSPIKDKYSDIFHISCQIHDMCLKTNGRTAASCDDEMYFNMKEQCEVLYPDFETAAALATCHVSALTWYGAVANWCDNPIVAGSCHRGGIEPSQCTPGTAHLSVYCDNSCIVYRADTQTKPWSARKEIGSASNWKQALEIYLSDVTKDTNVYILATDTGVVGGIMACMHGHEQTWCTKKGSNFIPVWTSQPNGKGIIGYPKGSGKWGNKMTDSFGIQDDDAPYWIWQNEMTNNKMIFRFNFNEVL